MNREKIEKLAELYCKNTHDAYVVATVCDEVIDKSGALLGKVRANVREKNRIKNAAS
jgi:hypothetical protein